MKTTKIEERIGAAVATGKMWADMMFDSGEAGIFGFAPEDVGDLGDGELLDGLTPEQDAMIRAVCAEVASEEYARLVAEEQALIEAERAIERSMAL